MNDNNKPLSEIDFLKYMDSFKGNLYKKLNKQNREIGEIKTAVNNNSDDIKDLEKKSDRWDRLNSIAVFLGAVLAGIVSALKPE